MSAINNKASVSIFDNQDVNDLKERQRLEELKRQAKVQQVKLDKRLNKQKILMGAFLGQVLATEGESEQMIREYFAIHFPDFSHQTQSDSMANYGEQNSLLDDNKYATDVSDPSYRGW